MSAETAPRSASEQNKLEQDTFKDGLPSRDEAIDTVRNEMNNMRTELQEAEEKANTPGFKATANDLVEAKTNLRDLRATAEPRIAALQELWEANGGSEIEAAEAAVAGLNFRSDANDRIKAQTDLRDAKNNFYNNLQESLKEDEPLTESQLAEAAALDRALEATPALRRMNEVSKEVADLRRLQEAGEANESDLARREALEDELNDLLLDYEASDDFNPAIADVLMDRDDKKARDEASHSTPEAEEASTGRRKLINDEPPTDETLQTERKLITDKPPTDESDVDAGQVKDMEAAHAEAMNIEKEMAHAEAVAIQEAEADLTRVHDIDEAYKQARKEDLERDGITWTSKPIRRLVVAFAGLKDKLAKSKAGAWTKDKLSGPERKGTRKMVAIAMGIIAVGGAALLVRYGLSNGGGGGSPNPDLADPGVDLGSSDGPDDVPSRRSIGIDYDQSGGESVPATPEIPEAAQDVVKDEGWLNTLKQAGLTETQAANLLPKILENTDPAIKEWVYPMADGNPGISHTGKIPVDVLKSIIRL